MPSAGFTMTRRLVRFIAAKAGSRLPLAALVGIAALGAACDGLIGTGGDDAPLPSSTPTNFVCDPAAVPAELPLRRLSHAQYANTVADLVRAMLPGEADSIITDIEPLVDRVPDDVATGPDKHYAGFTSLDQAVQQSHVDGAYAVAAAVGEALTVPVARLETVAGTCASDGDAGNDDACLDELIRRFGELALRRPVLDDDVAFYRGPAGVAPFDAADYADVLALIMNAPHALYFVEHGADGQEGVRVGLGPYELASRLSYHLWQSMPDEELFEAARSGTILSDEGYVAQVERMFAHPRTKAALATFFREWLDNTTLEELDSRSGNAVFDAFAGDFTPGPDLREHMIDEVVDSAAYYSFDTAGTFQDFFQSDRSFAKTEDLAALYGVAPWTGGEPPSFGSDARAGLLTRAAYLATGSANTRPIMKGVFIRKAILCDEIPPPPANAAANPPMLSDSLTTREVVEELTGQGACAGCHMVRINDLGFATENFDALGRERSEQTFYDEETGEVVGSAPIDTTSVPRVDDGDERPSSGAADVTDFIMASKKPYACFTRQYFRYTFGRIEDINRDACALSDVKQVLDEGRPLAEVLKTVALTAGFRQRSFE
jgi:hypothetical protein